MPQEIENKCCKLKKCITSSSCFDLDVLQLVSEIQVTFDMAEKIIALGLYVKQHTDNLLSLGMVTLERETGEFNAPNEFKQLICSKKYQLYKITIFTNYYQALKVFIKFL